MLRREGHTNAVELMTELEKIVTTYEDLKTQASSAIKATTMALHMANKPLLIDTYVFSSVDEILQDDPEMHATDLDFGKLIAVDISRAYRGGGFGTVYIGKGGEYGKVAVKRLYRPVSSSKILNLLHIQQFRREAAVWARLRHENILPLLGVCVLESTLHMVSPFMANGNVREYVTFNPGANRIAF
ncbi:hypothetical protein FRB99_008869, partial [Tulasnella sp. 403]